MTYKIPPVLSLPGGSTGFYRFTENLFLLGLCTASRISKPIQSTRPSITYTWTRIWQIKSVSTWPYFS